MALMSDAGVLSWDPDHRKAVMGLADNIVVSFRHEPQCCCRVQYSCFHSVCYMQHVSIGNINQGYILIG